VAIEYLEELLNNYMLWMALESGPYSHTSGRAKKPNVELLCQ
jgi:hypothetical protein